jgi:oligogalacturonide transporter
MVRENSKISKGEILIFASGDIFGGGAQLIISFYYLIFLTDIVKIRPALAGAIILLSKIWDAVSDPLMGLITDNTKTRWGRRKPYFFYRLFWYYCLLFSIMVPYIK